MVHSVVAYENPSPCTYHWHPIVILGIGRKMVLKILHPRRQSQRVQRPRQSSPDVPIEEQHRGVYLSFRYRWGGRHLRHLLSIIELDSLEQKSVAKILLGQSEVILYV